MAKAAKPRDWLGPFIQAEVRVVTEWACARRRSTVKVKEDPDCRFEDDRSNFRSALNPSLLPANPNVQITQIELLDGRVTAFVTDGFTKVKARFSRDVVRAIEAAIDDEIDAQTTGDVLALRNVTVESTPYGPPDGFIQLAISEAEYVCHFRKPLGQPELVAERPGVVGLLQQIESLRQEQQGPGRTAVRETLSRPAVGNSVPHVDEHTLSNQNDVQQSQQHRGQTQQTPITQRAFATQISTHARHTGPSLSNDGFEVEHGLNLDRPVAPSQTNKEATDRNLQQLAAANGTSVLLGLLGKRKAEGPAVRPGLSKLRALSPQIKQEELDDEGRDVSVRNTYEDSPHQQSLPMVATPDIESRTTLPTLDLTTQDLPNGQADAFETSFLASHHEPGPEVSKATSPSQSAIATKERMKAADLLPTNYWRCPIPRDQQSMLDKNWSWVPSVPGRQFPSPNVPMSILNVWNETASKIITDEPVKDRTKGSQNADVISEHRQDVEMYEIESESESSRSDSSEEVPYPWSSSLSQERLGLPPDSTMESNNESPIAPRHSPRRPDHDAALTGQPSLASTPLHRSSESPMAAKRRGSPIVRASSSSATAANFTSPRTQFPPPERTNRIPADVAPRSSPARSKASPTEQRPWSSASRDLPASTQQKGSDARPSVSAPRADVNFMNPPPKPFKLPQESPPRGAVVMVQGTQCSPRATQELEMSVPRSLDQRDPAEIHRQRRSEHFRPIQRREWIKANAAPGSRSQSGFKSLYEAYRKAWPTDPVDPAAFAGTIDEVFPVRQANETPVPSSSARSAPIASRSSIVRSRDTQPADSDRGLARPSASNVAEVARVLISPNISQSILEDNNRPAPSNSLPRPLRIQKGMGIRGTNEQSLGSAFKQTEMQSMKVEDSERVNVAEMTPFAEFAKAWRDIKPGGHFAARQPTQHSCRSTPRLHVLAWDLWK